MSKRIIEISLLFLFVVSLNAQDFPQRKRHMFSDNWVFSLSGGVTYGFTDYKESNLGLSLRGAGEYYFEATSNNIFSLKLYVASEKLSADDDRGIISSIDSSSRYIPPTVNTDIISVGVGISYSYSIKDRVFPFVGIGITNIWFDPKDGNGKPTSGNSGELYKKSDQTFFVEGGVKFLVSRNVSLNISAGIHVGLTDYLDDVAAGKANDSYLNGMIGISFAPFMKSDVKTQTEVKKEPTGIREETKIVPDTVGVKKVEPKIIVPVIIEKTPAETLAIVAPERFTLSADQIFNSNSAQIKFDAKNTLDSVIAVLKTVPDANWRIEGHMDSQGSEKQIRTLSFERARAILEFFAAFGGLDKAKFEIFGMGDKFPVGNNNTEAGRKDNRRIEIIIVK